MVVEATTEILTQQCVKTRFSSNLFLSGPLMEDAAHFEGRFFHFGQSPQTCPETILSLRLILILVKLTLRPAIEGSIMYHRVGLLCVHF